MHDVVDGNTLRVNIFFKIHVAATYYRIIHFLYNVTGRFVVEVMMTNCLRAWIFQNLLRK